MKLTAKVSCICGSTVEITRLDKVFANVYRDCPKHGRRPVNRSGKDAKEGIVRLIPGTAPAAVVSQKEDN